MIYIFAIGLFLNFVLLASWLYMSNWKFDVDDWIIIGFSVLNISGFALAIKISM